MNSSIDFLADGMLAPIILLGAVSLIVMVPNSKKIAVYSHIAMAGLTALLVAKFMAVVYQPSTARPFELLGINPGASYIDNPGFPSDHALLAMAVLFAVWYGVRNKWLTLFLAICVALVCIGRVLALVHTPLDIAGGLFAASVGALWYLNDIKVNVRPKKQVNLHK